MCPNSQTTTTWGYNKQVYSAAFRQNGAYASHLGELIQFLRAYQLTNIFQALSAFQSENMVHSPCHHDVIHNKSEQNGILFKQLHAQFLKCMIVLTSQVNCLALIAVPSSSVALHIDHFCHSFYPDLTYMSFMCQAFQTFPYKMVTLIYSNSNIALIYSTLQNTLL